MKIHDTRLLAVRLHARIVGQDLPHNHIVQTQSKKIFKHELGGDEYWEFEVFGRNLMGLLDVR